MVPKGATTGFSEDKTFDNFVDFNHSFDRFQKKHGLNLNLQASRHIVDVIPVAGKKFKDDLMFYSLDFVCGGGHRAEKNGRIHYVECTYKVNIRTTEDGQQLFVKFMDTLSVHNHRLKQLITNVVRSDPNVAFHQCPMDLRRTQAVCFNTSPYRDRVNEVASTSHLPALRAPPSPLSISPVKAVQVDRVDVETKTTRQKRQGNQDDIFVYQPIKKRRYRKSSNTANSSTTTLVSEAKNTPTPSRKSRRQMEMREAAAETPTTSEVNTASAVPSVVPHSGAAAAEVDYPDTLHGCDVACYRSRPRPTRVNPGKLRQSSAFVNNNISCTGTNSTRVRNFDGRFGSDHPLNNYADVQQLLDVDNSAADLPRVNKLILTKKMKNKRVQCSLTPTIATTTTTVSTQTTDSIFTNPKESTQTSDSTFTNPKEPQPMHELYINLLSARLRAQGSPEAAFAKFMVLGKLLQSKRAAHAAQTK